MKRYVARVDTECDSSDMAIYGVWDRADLKYVVHFDNWEIALAQEKLWNERS